MDNGNDMIETYLPIYIVLGLGMMTVATLLNVTYLINSFTLMS